MSSWIAWATGPYRRLWDRIAGIWRQPSPTARWRRPDPLDWRIRTLFDSEQIKSVAAAFRLSNWFLGFLCLATIVSCIATIASVWFQYRELTDPNALGAKQLERILERQLTEPSRKRHDELVDAINSLGTQGTDRPRVDGGSITLEQLRELLKSHIAAQEQLIKAIESSRGVPDDPSFRKLLVDRLPQASDYERRHAELLKAIAARPDRVVQTTEITEIGASTRIIKAILVFLCILFLLCILVVEFWLLRRLWEWLGPSESVAASLRVEASSKFSSGFRSRNFNVRADDSNYQHQGLNAVSD